VGTLRGFDEYVNMVLEDVTEYEYTATGRREVSYQVCAQYTDVFCAITTCTRLCADLAGPNIAQWGEHLYDGTWWISVVA
jgi:hypothetical protein